ncbi:MAG: transglutaminase-like domain-containing protein [Lachnospiraceae bacterium]|nr:transglutaminase-like domain-containing protein [Lachnospiraceae bacterium]
MAKNKQEKNENIELCNGVWLTNSFFEKKENRIFMLLLKGFLVYLLTMGSIGFYLSSFNIAYNFLLVNAVIFVTAFLCAGLYYRLLTENLGYLILLSLFGLLVLKLKIVINSGFYAIVNITVDEAARYFGVNAQKLYTEQIENRYLTVTMAAIFIGVVMNILLNVYISRRMQYMTAIFITMFLNFVPIYLEVNPDIIFVLMLLFGYAIAIVLKAGKHYSPQIAVNRNNRKYEKKKKEIAYVNDIKSVIETSIIIVAIVLVAVSSILRLSPQETFNQNYTPNKYKQVTMAAVGTFLVDGWQGFFDVKNSVGGMDRGQLGNVSSVKLDHMTDLVVQLTPYDYEPVYLRQFVGVEYVPYENRWEKANVVEDKGLVQESNALKHAYENNAAKSAKAKMYVKNVGGIPNEDYIPYYTNEKSQEDMGYTEIVFYPRIEGNDTKVDEHYYGEIGPYSYKDLYIHPENEEVIKDFVKEIGETKTEEDFTKALKDYYQQNIPYTVSPGKIPKQEDFVNYFLTDGRKGYCSYFASAAVLAYRAKGIPARYVEGYRIDYDQILMGDLVDETKYEDMYDGYSELGKTALIKVNVSDADAHAWVEIYNENLGWHVVDVTPSGGDEEYVEDFWSAFDRIINEDDTQDATQNVFQIPDNIIEKSTIAIVMFIAGLIAIGIVALGRDYYIFAYKYLRGDINEKLVLLFGRHWKKQCRRNKQIMDKVNYRDQVEILFRYNSVNEKNMSYNKDIITEILEKAGFSNEKISQSDFNMVKNWMSNNKIIH